MDHREEHRSGMQRAVSNHPMDQVGSSIVAQLHALLAPIFSDVQPTAVGPLAEQLSVSIRNSAQGLMLDSLDLEIVGPYMCFNKRRMGPEAQEFVTSMTLAGWFNRLGIVRLAFSPHTDPLTVESFHELCVQRASGHSDDKTSMRLSMLTIGFSFITEDFEKLLGELNHCSRLPQLLLYADSLGRLVDLDIGRYHQDATELIFPARRIGAQLVDALRRDAAAMVGLCHLRAVAGHRDVLRLDTAMIATAVALSLGFTDQQAMELAASALCCRIYEGDSIWVREPMAAKEAARAAGGLPELAQIITFELRLGAGRFTPHPAYGEAAEKHVASLVVEAASAYVDLIHGRLELPAHEPFSAVQRMIAHAEVRFDADVVSAMVNLLGLYPPGSPVYLNSGEAAVVVESPPSGYPLTRPAVRIADLSMTDVFKLHEPALSAYSIAGPAPRQACAVNPIYVTLF